MVLALALRGTLMLLTALTEIADEETPTSEIPTLIRFAREEGIPKAESSSHSSIAGGGPSRATSAALSGEPHCV